METIDSRSLYTHSLHRFIEQMKMEGGASQVLLAGCSNGGFMVMNMVLNYPHAYRGFLAICQGLIDRAVTGEDINVLKTVPLYLVYCTQDPALPPERFSIPTLPACSRPGPEIRKSAAVKNCRIVPANGKMPREIPGNTMITGHGLIFSTMTVFLLTPFQLGNGWSAILKTHKSCMIHHAAFVI